MKKIIVFQRIATVLGLLLALALLLAFCIGNGYIVFDHSAEWKDGTLVWNGAVYRDAVGDYTEKKTIAKTTDDWDIIEIEEDETHTFLVRRNFLDNYLMVREDYVIPRNGEITAVSWNGHKIEDTALCLAVSALIANRVTDFQYETGNLSARSDTQHMRPLYVAYEGCPVATEFVGYMGKVNGTWYITTEIPTYDSRQTPATVSCYTVPSEYHELLAQYLT